MSHLFYFNSNDVFSYHLPNNQSKINHVCKLIMPVPNGTGITIKYFLAYPIRC